MSKYQVLLDNGSSLDDFESREEALKWIDDYKFLKRVGRIQGEDPILVEA